MVAEDVLQGRLGVPGPLVVDLEAPVVHRGPAHVEVPRAVGDEDVGPAEEGVGHAHPVVDALGEVELLHVHPLAVGAAFRAAGGLVPAGPAPLEV